MAGLRQSQAGLNHLDHTEGKGKKEQSPGELLLQKHDNIQTTDTAVDPNIGS